VGEPCVDFVDLALAVELLHVASLVHDDIIDGGKLRRGRETVNAKYDDGVALLAGDALISKAMQLSSKYGEYIMREASGTALRMCAGELIDYNAQKNDKTLGVDEYLRMVGLKTASLLGMSCSIVAGYRGNGARNALHGYGCDVGTAFQIRDDVLDFMDSGECSGSNVVVSMKKRFGSTDRALEKAIELNHRYVKNAVRRLSGKRMMVLESYAKMTELNLD
jgi:geranylgeranyl pyrophosphate synthase